MPKANHKFSAQRNNDSMGNVTSPSSNLHMTEASTFSQKPVSNSKSKFGVSKISHGRQNKKAVGNKPPRKNHAPISFVHPTNPSIPHHDLGLVRPGANASMEPHFSSNSKEPNTRLSSTDRPSVARMGQPLVEISNGCSNNC